MPTQKNRSATRRIYFLIFFLAGSFGPLLEASWNVQSWSPQSYLFFQANGDVWTGGSLRRADLKRCYLQSDELVERWIWPFRSRDQAPKSEVARFQLRRFSGPHEEKAHLQLVFFGIQNNAANLEDIDKHLAKSRFVKKLRIYPAIEEGDFGMEWEIPKNTQVYAYQNASHPSQLVIEFEPASLKKTE